MNDKPISDVERARRRNQSFQAKQAAKAAYLKAFGYKGGSAPRSRVGDVGLGDPPTAPVPSLQSPSFVELIEKEFQGITNDLAYKGPTKIYDTPINEPIKSAKYYGKIKLTADDFSNPWTTGAQGPINTAPLDEDDPFGG